MTGDDRSDEQSVTPPATAPPRALVDVWAGSLGDHARLVGDLAALIGERSFNVLGLGPPLRLSVDADAFVVVLDQISFERVRIRFWPFSLDDRRGAGGVSPG